MRKQQLTLTIDKDLRGLLSRNAARENRSLANYVCLLLAKAARAEPSLPPVEQQQSAA
jgi:hypothetical protein